MFSINRFSVYFLVGGFFVGCVFSLISALNKITELKSEIKQFQNQLQQCKNDNQNLLNQLQIQQNEYEKAVKEIQEASVKPVKRVYIRKVVKQPVYITNDECEKMVDLIDQAQELMQK